MKKNMGLNTSVHYGILQKYLCKNSQINILKWVLNIKTSCTSLFECLDQVTVLIIFSEKIKKDKQCVSVSILRIFCLRGSAVLRRLTRQTTFEVACNYLQLSPNIIFRPTLIIIFFINSRPTTDSFFRVSQKYWESKVNKIWDLYKKLYQLFPIMIRGLGSFERPHTVGVPTFSNGNVYLVAYNWAWQKRETFWHLRYVSTLRGCRIW